MILILPTFYLKTNNDRREVFAFERYIQPQNWLLSRQEKRCLCSPGDDLCSHLPRLSTSADGLNKDTCRHNTKCSLCEEKGASIARKVLIPFQCIYYQLWFSTFAFFWFLANPYSWNKEAHLSTWNSTNCWVNISSVNSVTSLSIPLYPD